MKLVLEIEGLTAGYGPEPAIRDIDLAIRAGQFVSLIGPNGAGKSTLLRCIVGLMTARRGNIRRYTEKVGYVPQQLQFDRALPLTVAEFLSLKLIKTHRWILGPSRQERRRMEHGLEEMGARHLLHRRLGQLSGGELQRVIITYALLDEPELLLLDEPTTGVDLRGGLSFDGLLHHLIEHRQLAILMVSHDLHLVEHISHEVYCLNQTICSHGHPNEVLKPENLANAYGHPHGMVPHQAGGAFIPLSRIRQD